METTLGGCGGNPRQSTCFLEPQGEGDPATNATKKTGGYILSYGRLLNFTPNMPALLA